MKRELLDRVKPSCVGGGSTAVCDYPEPGKLAFLESAAEYEFATRPWHLYLGLRPRLPGRGRLAGHRGAHPQIGQADAGTAGGHQGRDRPNGVVGRPVTEMNAVRFSTHFYNTEDEVARAAEAVAKVANAAR